MREGGTKMPKKETFTNRFEETRGGRVDPKNLKFGETSFMDGPLHVLLICAP